MTSHILLPELHGDSYVISNSGIIADQLKTLCCDRGYESLRRESQCDAEALAAVAPARKILRRRAHIGINRPPPRQMGPALRGGLRLRSLPAIASPAGVRSAIARSGVAAFVMNWFFCISLWLSLLLALWMSRGWIGLFFSGQVLSTGTCLVKKLVRKTQTAFSGNICSANRLEGERYVP